MNGALPPSSSDNFFNVAADSRASSLPTGVEPVNVILRTRPSASQSAAASTPRSRDAAIRFSTPAGTPASCASNASASAVSGVSSAGFATTVQPAARAGAILRAIIASGKFHGVIAATMPIGSFTALKRLPRCCCGIRSPYVRVASSANHSTYDAPYATSPRASASGLPCSRDISFARSSVCATIAACQARRIAARSRAGVARHAGSARAAASVAARASAAPLSGTWATVSSVAGSVTAKRRPSSASRQLPSIRLAVRTSSVRDSVSGMTDP
ncbi:Uncharacterised protein [Burkholderia cenocepacia]|nr:Uncharacterised protein [Burkholderia cenocepacia]